MGLCGVVVEATWLFHRAHCFIIIFWPDIRRKKTCLWQKIHSSLKSLLHNSCSVSMWYLNLTCGNPLRDIFDSELKWNFPFWPLWVVVVLPGVVNETGLCGVVVEATWLFCRAHRFIIIFWLDIRRKKSMSLSDKKIIHRWSLCFTIAVLWICGTSTWIVAIQCRTLSILNFNETSRFGPYGWSWFWQV